MAELLKDLSTLFEGGVNLGLDATADLLARYGILLAAFLLVIGLVIFRTRIRMSWWQKAAMTMLRMFVIILLVLALIEVTQTRFRKALAVVFLADASASIPDEELEKAGEILKEAQRLKGDTVIKSLVFGAAPSPLADDETPARMDENPETNIQKALHVAYDMFPEGYSQRAVILTDGNQTHGDLEAEAAVAADRGVEVSLMPLPTRKQKDCLVQSINLPKRARTGEEIVLSARVLSNHETGAEVRLLRGKRVIEKRQVELRPGENWQEFTTTAAGAGVATYKVEVETEEDSDRANDQMDGRMEILGKPRVLFVSGNPEADVNLVQSLKDGGIRVQPAPLAAFPKRLGEINYFDLVVLSDIDPKEFTQANTDLLGLYLRDYGGGLVHISGDKSSEMGKKEDLPLEALLPVRFKEKKKTEPNPVAMMLVMDKSNSMGRQNKFGMAIRAAKDAIAELPPKSKAGVVVFDDRPYITVDMTDVEDVDAIIAKLDTLGVDGGTSIFPALESAYHRIRRLPNKVRHVILLSDGFSNSRYRQNVRLVEEYRKKKITITTVGLGQECDPKHLKKIADEGEGKFYHVFNIESIPRIFIKETKRITRTNVVEKTFKPRKLKEGDLIKKVKFDKVPDLTGYNASTPKPSSETFLLAEESEPLLSRWRFGLGRAVTYTADSGGAWSESWKDWDQYSKFWTSVIRGTLRDLNFQLFKVSAKAKGEKVLVQVDAADTQGSFLNNLALRMNVTDPSDEKNEVSLRQVRPGGYEGEFPLSGYGSYSIGVSPILKDRQASETFSRISIAPPSEFVRLEPDQKLMRRVAEKTGGMYNPTLTEVLAPAAENFPLKKPLWPYLILLALGLYLLNLLLRRT